MAGIKEIEDLVKTNELKTERLIRTLDKKSAKQIYLDIDNVSDILRLFIVPTANGITAVHYIDEHVGLIFDPVSKEVLGFQVDAFEHSFMPMNEEVAKVWKLSNEFINIFVNGAKPQDELNNIEIFVRDGVLHVVVNENLIDTVVLTTYEEEYK